MPADETLRLPDGRQLCFLRIGSPADPPFFYFHGMPGSRFESLLVQRQAWAQGVQLVAIDRPGYGLSDACADRQLLDWPADVTAVADALGMKKFGVIGVSGGGPYALACACAIPERLTCTGIVCGLGAVHEAALLAAMSFFSRTAFTLEKNHPALFRLLYGAPLEILSRRAPRRAVQMLALHCGEPDRSVLLQPDVLNNISGSLTQAFRQGTGAAARDIHLYQNPWGFQLAELTADIHFWHGSSDPVVPSQHSLHAANQVKNAGLTLVPGAGHFSLPVLYADAILAALKSRCVAHGDGT